MRGWRLETADRADIPVSFNPGSSSVVADLQELPSTVHSASWVAPLSYLGDKVTMSLCSSEPSLCLLHPCVSIVYWVSGRKHQKVQVTKTEEIRLTTNAEEMLPPAWRAENVRASGTPRVSSPANEAMDHVFLDFYLMTKNFLLGK